MKVCCWNVGVEDEEHFFSTQERQSIVLHLLYAIRIIENQTINGVKFKVDQSLSKCSEFFSFEVIMKCLFSSTWFRKKFNSTSYSIT